MKTTLAGRTLNPIAADQIDRGQQVLEIALGRSAGPHVSIDDAFIERLFSAMPLPQGPRDSAAAAARFADRFDAFALLGFQLGSFGEGVTAEAIARAFAGFCESGRIFFEPSAEIMQMQHFAGEQTEWFRFLQGGGELLRSRILHGGGALVRALSVVADSAFGSEALMLQADALRAMHQAVTPADVRGLALFADSLMSDVTRARVMSWVDAIEASFFHVLGEEFAAILQALRGDLERGDDAALHAGMVSLQAMGERLRGDCCRIVDLSGSIDHLRQEGCLCASAAARWADDIAYLRFIAHDYGSIAATIWASVDVGSRHSTPEVLGRLLTGLAEISDVTTVQGLTQLASYYARLSGGLTVEGRSSALIPEAMRRDLFRAVYELFRNAMKYRNPEKPQPEICARILDNDAGVVRISIRDKGVGIRDVAAAMREGVRERLDLAPGTGLGLAGIAASAAKYGWDFEVQSEPGQWTEATIAMDTSSWDAGMPMVAAGMGMPAAPLAARPLR